MKKLLALVFITTLIISCSKKNDKPWQDSNTMLQEPEKGALKDSATGAKADTTQVAAAVSVDSTSATK